MTYRTHKTTITCLLKPQDVVHVRESLLAFKTCGYKWPLKTKCNNL